MISTQQTIPLLVHEDCMDSIKTNIADQQASLSKIANNTVPIDQIRVGVESIESNTSSIRVSSSNTATATSSLYSSVGTTADESTENTVIGLLKSISNKITTF